MPGPDRGDLGDNGLDAVSPLALSMEPEGKVHNEWPVSGGEETKSLLDAGELESM